MTGLLRAGRDLASRLYRTFVVRSELERPLPAVRIEIGRAVPAWALQLAVAAVGLACASLLATRGLHWALAVAGAAVLAIRPAPGLAQIYAAALGAGLLLTRYEPWSAAVFALVLGVHLMVQLGSIVQGLHRSAQVELAALAAPARRFAAVQAGAQILAVASAWIAAREVHAVWLSVAAGAALAALAWLLLTAATAQRVEEPAAPAARD